MAARQQLAEAVDDPSLTVALERREGHPEEVELDGRAALDDRAVIGRRRKRISMADDDPGQVGALGLEDVELIEPDRRLDGMGRDREPGAAGRPGGGAVDALLLRGQPRLLGPDLADNPGPDAGSRTPSVASPTNVRERVHRPAVDDRLRPGSGRRDTSRSPSRPGGRWPATRPATRDRARPRRGSGRRGPATGRPERRELVVDDRRRGGAPSSPSDWDVPERDRGVLMREDPAEVRGVDRDQDGLDPAVARAVRSTC